MHDHGMIAERPAAPARIHVLAKPTGAICNLDCSYCFYLDKEQLYPGSNFRMSDEVLERYIQQLVESHRGDRVTVAWQGGEPTLMGLDFYRRVVELEEKHGRPGLTFENTLQTNGTLLDDAWCAFFREHRFLIGISIDGPRELHDHHRYDKGGKPTFDKVIRGLRLLQSHGVEHNVLCTVNRVNAERPLEVYRFFRDELGAQFLQFIPVVERVLGSVVSDATVRPEQFGSFLVAVFDEWVRNDVGSVYVQTFDAALRNWMGAKSSGMCVFDETCGHALALEHNGDLYSCDHFVEPRHHVGNLKDKRVLDVIVSDEQLEFGREKLAGLPKACRECDVRFACHGECPKNRFTKTADGERGLNYLCAGYKTFFRHIDAPMRRMAQLVDHGLPAARVMPMLRREDDATRRREAFARTGRNDPCPCGSGRKRKRCHAVVA